MRGSTQVRSGGGAHGELYGRGYHPQDTVEWQWERTGGGVDLWSQGLQDQQRGKVGKCLQHSTGNVAIDVPSWKMLRIAKLGSRLFFRCKTREAKRIVDFAHRSYDIEYIVFQLKVPAQIIKILEKLPEERSQDDIECVARLMRHLPSFRKYTTDMQSMMCRIVTYMKWASSTEKSETMWKSCHSVPASVDILNMPGPKESCFCPRSIFLLVSNRGRSVV